ncbi:hypothetical protein BD769DRAFT_1388225 [Suillus cothurnatus]|nr:hypothetical protein BD769DRAFT_1388225 [Suillus cothurnatus]
MSSSFRSNLEILIDVHRFKGLKAAFTWMQQELPFDFLTVRSINAITGALTVKAEWEAMRWNNPAVFFLHTAELVSRRNAWQAEIDVASKLLDFFCFSIKYVGEHLPL